MEGNKNMTEDSRSLWKCPKAKKKARRSPAIQFLDYVWGYLGRTSWVQINGSMREALHLAIRAGFTFDRDDFATIEEKYRAHYWLGQDNAGLGEYVYTSIVKAGNTSAAASFEKWKGRPAFIFDRVEGKRSKDRLAVGSEFFWDGAIRAVTSLGADSLIACTYDCRIADGGYPDKRLKTRRTITLAELRADMKARKQAGKNTNMEKHE